MPFDSRYSEVQRAACIAASVDRDMVAPAVVAAAAAGTLPGPGEGLEGFTVPIGTVRQWARDEKRRRHSLERAAQDPGEVMREGLEDLQGKWRAMTKATRAGRGAHKATPGTLRDLASAGRELARFHRELNGQTGARSNGAKTAGPGAGEPPSSEEGSSADGASEAAPDFIGTLAKEAGERD